jgi:hypothetical protein
MFPPPIAESDARSEDDFRTLTLEALQRTVDALAAGR